MRLYYCAYAIQRTVISCACVSIATIEKVGLMSCGNAHATLLQKKYNRALFIIEILLDRKRVQLYFKFMYILARVELLRNNRASVF